MEGPGSLTGDTQAPFFLHRRLPSVQGGGVGVDSVADRCGLGRRRDLQPAGTRLRHRPEGQPTFATSALKKHPQKYPPGKDSEGVACTTVDDWVVSAAGAAQPEAAKTLTVEDLWMHSNARLTLVMTAMKLLSNS